MSGSWDDYADSWKKAAENYAKWASSSWNTCAHQDKEGKTTWKALPLFTGVYYKCELCGEEKR